MILLAAFVCLATAISANKVLLFSLTPELLVGIRMTVAAPLLAGYSYVTEGRFLPLRILKESGWWLLIIALFTTFFPSNLKAYALAHMPSYKMAYFGTLDPFVASLYSFFFLGETLSKRQWSGILLGSCGMLILCLGSSPLEDHLHAFSFFSYPELAALLAIVLSRWGWIQGQQLLKKEHLTPLQFNSITMALGGLLSLLIVQVKGAYSVDVGRFASLPLLVQTPFSELSSYGQLSFLLGYTIFVGNILGYTLYAHALKKYSATFIALTGFTIPLTVQLFGWLFLGEALSLSFFIACGITCLGIALFFIDESSHRGELLK